MSARASSEETSPCQDAVAANPTLIVIAALAPRHSTGRSATLRAKILGESESVGRLDVGQRQREFLASDPAENHIVASGGLAQNIRHMPQRCVAELSNTPTPARHGAFSATPTIAWVRCFRVGTLAGR